MKRKYSLHLAIGLTLLLKTQVPQAKINGFGEAEGWLFGLGNISDYSPYEGVDSPDNTFVPYVAYSWENAHLGIEGFTYQFFTQDIIEVSLAIEPRWSFANPDDSVLFADIERDIALEVGLSASMDIGPVFLSAGLLSDISGTHNGFEARLEIGVQADLGAFELTLSTGLIHRDSGLSQHLYGVNETEVRQGLSAYSAPAETHPMAQASVLYTLNNKSAFLLFAGYEKLPSSVLDSPLINKKRDASLGAVFLYKF